MAGRHEFGLGRAGHQRLVEGDAGIAVQDRIAASYQPIPVLEHRRHAQDLESALLALGDSATEKLECLPKEGAYEVGLQAAGLGALHLLADCCDRVGVHALGGKLAFGDQALDRIDVHRVVHLLEEATLRLWGVAVADGVHQEVAKGLALEQLAKDVVDFATQGGPGLLQLLQEALVDLALAGVGRAQVPEVADLGLADAVDAPEALLQTVRVPRQVVVDHEVGAALEVHALTGGVVRDQHPNERVGVEGRDRRAPSLAWDAAVDDDHRGRIADTSGDLLLQILQCVLGLREDQDLPPQPVTVSSMMGSSRMASSSRHLAS